MNARSYINGIAEGANLLIEQSAIVGIAYKRLSGKLKSHVTKRQLASFVDALENGANLDGAATFAHLPTVVAVDLMSELDRSGLL